MEEIDNMLPLELALAELLGASKAVLNRTKQTNINTTLENLYNLVNCLSFDTNATVEQLTEKEPKNSRGQELKHCSGHFQSLKEEVKSIISLEFSLQNLSQIDVPNLNEIFSHNRNEQLKKCLSDLQNASRVMTLYKEIVDKSEAISMAGNDSEDLHFEISQLYHTLYSLNSIHPLECKQIHLTDIHREHIGVIETLFSFASSCYIRSYSVVTDVILRSYEVVGIITHLQLFALLLGMYLDGNVEKSFLYDYFENSQFQYALESLGYFQESFSVAIRSFEKEFGLAHLHAEQAYSIAFTYLQPVSQWDMVRDLEIVQLAKKSPNSQIQSLVASLLSEKSFDALQALLYKIYERILNAITVDVKRNTTDGFNNILREMAVVEENLKDFKKSVEMNSEFYRFVFMQLCVF